MRTTAFVLGLIGGIIGLISAFFALTVGGVASAFDAGGGASVMWLAFAAALASVAGIVGGSLAKAKPTAAAILMLIATIVGFVSISLFFIIAGLLLLLGSIFAFVAARQQKTMQTHAPSPPGVPHPGV